MLVHDAQVIEADTLQYPRDAFEPRAVERRVDDAQLTRRPRIFGFDGLRRDLVEEAIDNGVVNPLDQTGGKRLLEVHALDVIEKVQAVNALLDFDGGLRGNLAPIVTVHLVAVVGGRIMARRHVDSRAATKFANGEREDRRGLNGTVDVRDDTIGGEHAGSRAHELLSPVATVTCDGDARRLVMRVEVIGEALGCLGDGVDVHAVGPEPDDTAQAGCPEGKLAIERVVELLDGSRLFA